MKKWIIALLMLFCLGMAAGCGAESSSPAPASSNQQAPDLHGKKVLVAYYSLTGTTKKAAGKIADMTGGDLFFIEPADPYPTEHDPCLERDMKEIETNARPAVKSHVDNMAQYDVIFVGYPIWYYQAPMFINTFLESYDLSGKTVIPFCTSGGYPIDKSVGILKDSAGKAAVTNGLRYDGDDKELSDWIKSFGLLKQ